MLQETVQNLTLNLGLVVPVPHLAAMPGHDLVVFKITRQGGHRYHSTCSAEEDAPLGFLERMLSHSSFVGYAVRRAEDLRREVRRPVTTWDQAGSFELVCQLTLQVVDPRALVEHLGQDPLRQVEEMAGDVFRQAASRVDWRQVEERGIAFEDSLRRSVYRDAAGLDTPNLERVRSFARRRGLEVLNLDLSVVFSAEFGEVLRRLRMERDRREILKATSETANLQSAQENVQALISATGKNLERVLANIADGVNSPATLRTVVAELVDLFGQMRGLVASSASEATLPAAALRAQVLALLPGQEGAAPGSLADRVQRLVAFADDLVCPDSARRSFVSAVLHLYAESTLGAVADGGVLASCKERVQKAASEILPALATVDQHERLRDLVRCEDEARLAGEGVAA